MNKVKEKLLLYKIQELKDPESFSELYDLMADQIYRFIYYKVDNTETAQDITSDVFFKCWKQLTNRNEKNFVRKLVPFLYMIARNSVIDYYRSDKKNLYIQEEHHQIFIQASGKEKVEEKIEAEFIKKIIEKLKDSYKEIIILKHIDELSINEISKIIEKSNVATRVLLHRANQALKREYEKATKRNQ